MHWARSVERFTSLVTASSPAHHTIFSRKAARTDDKSSNACSAACRAGADGAGGSGVRPSETAEPRSLPCGSSIEFETGEPNSASISSFISRTAAVTRGAIKGCQTKPARAGSRCSPSLTRCVHFGRIQLSWPRAQHSKAGWWAPPKGHPLTRAYGLSPPGQHRGACRLVGNPG